MKWNTFHKAKKKKKKKMCFQFHIHKLLCVTHLKKNVMHGKTATCKIFASEVITSHRSNWIKLLLLCTGAPLVSGCDQFNRGSRHVKCDPVDLVIYSGGYNKFLESQVTRQPKKSCPSCFKRSYLCLDLAPVTYYAYGEGSATYVRGWCKNSLDDNQIMN